MHQCPTPIWNEIAQTQEIKSPLWASLFRATDLPTALQPLTARLEALNADTRTIRAFLLVAPLLRENLAISRFIEETGRDSLRSSLPEIVTVDEAMILASEEFGLTTAQQRVLLQLLRRPWMSLDD